MILDQKSLGSRPNRTTENQPLTMNFVGGFLFLAKKRPKCRQNEKKKLTPKAFIYPSNNPYLILTSYKYH